jgi:hypothetical protein
VAPGLKRDTEANLKKAEENLKRQGMSFSLCRIRYLEIDSPVLPFSDFFRLFPNFFRVQSLGF